jgi:hypothetical protein
MWQGVWVSAVEATAGNAMRGAIARQGCGPARPNASARRRAMAAGLQRVKFIGWPPNMGLGTRRVTCGHRRRSPSGATSCQEFDVVKRRFYYLTQGGAAMSIRTKVIIEGEMQDPRKKGLLS